MDTQILESAIREAYREGLAEEETTPGSLYRHLNKLQDIFDKYPPPDQSEGPHLVVCSQESGKGCHWVPLSEAHIVIGRLPDCQVAIPSKQVSRKHCTVTLDNDGIAVIEDADSKNGTFVNEERVTRRALRAGDVIRVGDYLLVYVD